MKKQKLQKLFAGHFGEKPEKMVQLPPSGSYREYYRMYGKFGTVMGVYNQDAKENNAFIEFTRHFLKYGLNVPELIASDKENHIYLLEDLGDQTLFSFLSDERREKGFTSDIINTYKKVIEYLPEFQIKAGASLDYSYCYPRDRFDKQSMMWDMNYFKYYFLKLAKIPFDEQLLEDDFQRFADYLLEQDSDFFLYRDFQSRNIMIRNGEVFFIDYQGGRKGALQYDIASLLYDAKADIPQSVREELFDYYLSVLENFISLDKTGFRNYYFGYVMIRIMQAMGAYGFRGFYEKKKHFLASIPYAIENLKWILQNVELPVQINTLKAVLHSITESEFLINIGNQSKVYTAKNKLTVRINSFSYKNGLPLDGTGNGGGFVFDCRAIHNPGKYDQYKSLTGKNEEVIRFFEKENEMEDFLNGVYNLVDQSVEKYIKRDFTDLMVSFGCTGGQHRSVYCAEKLAKHLKSKFSIQIILIHRELKK